MALHIARDPPIDRLAAPPGPRVSCTASDHSVTSTASTATRGSCCSIAESATTYEDDDPTPPKSTSAGMPPSLPLPRPMLPCPAARTPPAASATAAMQVPAQPPQRMRPASATVLHRTSARSPTRDLHMAPIPETERTMPPPVSTLQAPPTAFPAPPGQWGGSATGGYLPLASRRRRQAPTLKSGTDRAAAGYHGPARPKLSPELSRQDVLDSIDWLRGEVYMLASENGSETGVVATDDLSVSLDRLHEGMQAEYRGRSSAGPGPLGGMRHSLSHGSLRHRPSNIPHAHTGTGFRPGRGRAVRFVHHHDPLIHIPPRAGSSSERTSVFAVSASAPGTVGPALGPPGSPDREPLHSDLLAQWLDASAGSKIPPSPTRASGLPDSSPSPLRTADESTRTSMGEAPTPTLQTAGTDSPAHTSAATHFPDPGSPVPTASERSDGDQAVQVSHPSVSAQPDAAPASEQEGRSPTGIVSRVRRLLPRRSGTMLRHRASESVLMDLSLTRTIQGAAKRQDEAAAPPVSKNHAHDLPLSSPRSRTAPSWADISAEMSSITRPFHRTAAAPLPSAPSLTLAPPPASILPAPATVPVPSPASHLSSPRLTPATPRARTTSATASGTAARHGPGPTWPPDYQPRAVPGHLGVPSGPPMPRHTASSSSLRSMLRRW